MAQCIQSSNHQSSNHESSNQQASKQSSNRSFLAGLFVLAVLFVFSASLTAHAAAPALAGNVALAGPDRPPEVPQGYAITPFGYFHPSCVFMINEGETLLPDGRLRHANGTVDTNASACAYPHYTHSGLPVPAGVTAASRAIDPVIRGWLEYVSTTTTASYSEITATWTVPPQPATNDGQTVFFFPGFEDSNDVLSIVQPVLQWYTPGPWAVASWNCCMAGTVWESHPVKVSPGDAILGTIISACKRKEPDCGDWKIISEDQTTGKTTTLHKTPAEGQVWNWAFGAVLEVYGVQQCSDFPANDSVEFTVQLYDENRNLISDPGWAGTPAGSGITPACNYGVNATATQETVEY